MGIWLEIEIRMHNNQFTADLVFANLKHLFSCTQCFHVVKLYVSKQNIQRICSYLVSGIVSFIHGIDIWYLAGDKNEAAKELIQFFVQPNFGSWPCI